MLNKNKIEYLLVVTLIKVIQLIGLKGARIIAKFLALIMFYIIPVRKKVAIENISAAFPNLKKNEVNRVALGSYKNFLVTFIELFMFPTFNKKKLHSLVKCNSMDLLKEKYELNKGLIFLTGHFGSWELGAASVGSQLGISMRVLAKNQRNPFVNDLVNSYREFFGNKVIKVGASIRELYAAIKNGNIVGVVGDQRGPKEGLRVNLFGKPTAIYPGTAAIAIKTKAPVITVFVKRLKDGTYEGIAEEINVNDLPENEEDGIIEFNQRYMNILEKHIKDAPEQWFWQHKIWKY